MAKATVATLQQAEREHDTALLIENVEFLLGVGEHPERIAARLGMTQGAISKRLYNHKHQSWKVFERGAR